MVDSVNGKGAGLVLTFETKDKEAIEIKVGLSYTSTDNARKNLIAEAGDLDLYDDLLQRRDQLHLGECNAW